MGERDRGFVFSVPLERITQTATAVVGILFSPQSHLDQRIMEELGFDPGWKIDLRSGTRSAQDQIAIEQSKERHPGYL